MANFKYSDFVSYVKKDGLARQNRFMIDISVPQAMVEYQYWPILLLCKGVSLPSVNVSSQPVRLTGEVFEAPYDRVFSGCAMSFYVDRKMSVKMFFDVWINKIQNTNTRIMGYYGDFVAPKITITILDKSEFNAPYQIELFRAYPKSIGTVMLDQTATDMMLLDVQFEYQYYRTIGEVGDRVVTSDEPGRATPITQTVVSSLNNKAQNILMRYYGETPTSTLTPMIQQSNTLVSGANSFIRANADEALMKSVNGINGQVGIATDQLINNFPAGSFPSNDISASKVNPAMGAFGNTATTVLTKSISYMKESAASVINTAVMATISGGAIPDMETITSIANSDLQQQRP